MLLLRTCLQYLLLGDFKENEQASDPKINQVPDDEKPVVPHAESFVLYPFDMYATFNWTFHAKQAGERIRAIHRCYAHFFKEVHRKF
jgi:hypothetical protein